MKHLLILATLTTTALACINIGGMTLSGGWQIANPCTEQILRSDRGIVIWMRGAWFELAYPKLPIPYELSSHEKAR